MIVIDGMSIVVALPTIKMDLGVSDLSIVWVVNAYLITYAGFLLLSGRLSDLFGHRRLFLCGISLFTLASLACALSSTWGLLVAARLGQGLAGAAVVTAALALVIGIFESPFERAEAVAIYGFASSAGSAVGVLLSGVLTSWLGWRWIFLINLPIGVSVCIFGNFLLPTPPVREGRQPLDLLGAITVTMALMVAVYAVVASQGATTGFTRVLALLLIAVTLFMLFIRMEALAAAPLVPLSVFSRRNLVICCASSGLFAAATCAGSFVSLYLQGVLGYSSLQSALAFLPSSLIMAAFALGLSAKLVVRFGVKRPMVAGLLVAAAGLTLLTRTPMEGSATVYMVTGLVLLGAGAGTAFNPTLIAAMHDVPQRDSGLVSGIMTTFSTMGVALGFALFAAASAHRSRELLAAGRGISAAVHGGYQIAFLMGAISAFCATAVSIALVPNGNHDAGRSTIPM